MSAQAIDLAEKAVHTRLRCSGHKTSLARIQGGSTGDLLVAVSLVVFAQACCKAVRSLVHVIGHRGIVEKLQPLHEGVHRDAASNAHVYFVTGLIAGDSTHVQGSETFDVATDVALRIHPGRLIHDAKSFLDHVTTSDGSGSHTLTHFVNAANNMAPPPRVKASATYPRNM